MKEIEKSKVDKIGIAPERYEIYQARTSLSLIKRMIYEAKETDDPRLESLEKERDKFIDLLAEDVDDLTPKAENDPLTGAYNKAFFDECANRMYERSDEGNICVVLIDGDNFKNINDTYGHHVGDKVIKHISDGAKDNLRGYDLLGRIGGEEFAVVLPDTDCDTGYRVAERIREYMAENHPEGLDEITQTLSIGVACRDDDTRSINDLLENADKAMYQAKNGGKNRVVVYAGDNE